MTFQSQPDQNMTETSIDQLDFSRKESGDLLCVLDDPDGPCIHEGLRLGGRNDVHRWLPLCKLGKMASKVKGKILEGQYFYPCKCGKGHTPLRDMNCLECRIREAQYRSKMQREASIVDTVCTLIILFAAVYIAVHFYGLKAFSG